MTAIETLSQYEAARAARLVSENQALKKNWSALKAYAMNPSGGFPKLDFYIISGVVKCL